MPTKTPKIKPVKLYKPIEIKQVSAFDYPNLFSGLDGGAETLTKQNFGIGGYQIPSLQFEPIKVVQPAVLPTQKPNLTTDRWDKFLRLDPRMQNDIVNYWNGEVYKTFNGLHGRDLNSFKHWYLKQKPSK